MAAHIAVAVLDEETGDMAMTSGQVAAGEVYYILPVLEDRVMMVLRRVIGEVVQRATKVVLESWVAGA